MKSMRKYSVLFGSLSTYLLIAIYLLLWLIFKFLPQSTFVYCGIFYFVACFIFGPAITIFALLFAYFAESNLMTEGQFWLGVPIAYLLPGTSINIAVYYGTIIDGLRGAILSWIFVYLPAFLSVYGILPDWYIYRDRPGIQRLLMGVSCVSSGFALASVRYQ
jgi:chromate transporter